MKVLSTASLTSCIVVLLQNPTTAAPQQTPQGSIEGTVTRLDSAQPIRNARVTASLRGPARAASAPPAFTDGNGKFAVTGLSDGVYGVSVLANGFVGRGTPVTVNGGQRTQAVNVALTPAANIGGRVHDTSDQPLAGMAVELLEFGYDEHGRRTYESVGTTQTNDRGEYRMYWITPGRYYLRAGDFSKGGSPRFYPTFSGNDVAASGSDIPSVAGYAFYPSAPDIGTARAIDLQPGADLRTIDVAVIVRPRTFSIRGNLIDSRTGQPPKTANVFAEAHDVGLTSDSLTNVPSPAYNGATGTFEIRNLLPGTYSVVAMVQTPPPYGQPAPPTTEASGVTSVTVTDSDVNNVSLSVVRGATVAGRLLIDGEMPPLTGVIQPRVHLIRIGGNETFDEDLDPGFISADRTFRINGVGPGDYQFDLAGFPLNSIGYIKEARLDGADVLDVPLRISGSSDKQLELVLRVGGGEITGTVTDVKSQPVSDARVVLIPDRARFRIDLYRTAFTNPDGRFTLAHLAPGDYKVFSWESLPDYAWLDPDLLGRFEPRGRGVHVSESSNTTINVEIIPAEGAR